MNEHRLNRFKGSIYLTGFMASGKSTAGKALARKMELPFRDLDTIIREGAGKSITQIFEEEGEEVFRKLEWQYLLELSRSFRGVVALGGGALQNQQIVDHLKVTGLLIYIRTPMETIIERVYRNTKRPIVLDSSGRRKDKEALFNELKALYSSRVKFYEQAQITMDSSAFDSNDEMINAMFGKIKKHV